MATRWRGFYQIPTGILWTAVAYSAFIVAVVLTLGRANTVLVGWCARLWGRIVLFILSVRLEVVGRDNVRERIPRILVFNHTSLLDLFVICALYPPAGVAVVKKEIARLPIVGLLWWLMGMVFIDRGNGPAAKASVARAAAKVRRLRQTIILAPEGTRSIDGAIGPFKKGAFHLALETGAPIVPLVIVNAHHIQPKGKLYAQPGTLRVIFLEAIPTEGWRRETLDAHVAAVREVYLRTLAEERDEPAPASAEAERIYGAPRRSA